MVETILGVPVKAAPKEPTRVLDTVVDLTDKAQTSPPRRRSRRSDKDAVQAHTINADATNATPPTSERKRRAAGSSRARSITAVAGASAPPSADGSGQAEDRDGIQLITADLIDAAEALAHAARAHSDSRIAALTDAEACEIGGALQASVVCQPLPDGRALFASRNVDARPSDRRPSPGVAVVE